MDAVMLVDVVDEHGRVRLRQRVVGAGSQCRIGRSVLCDIVLDDAYAAAEHTLLTLRDDDRAHVQDLGTLNGTRLDGEFVPADGGQVIEQGEMIVGRTCLRVRTRHAALPPERVFRRDLLRRHRTALAVLGAVGCVGFGAFFLWLDAPESLAAATLAATLVTVLGLALWTGLWSVITRLNHGHWHVRMHLAIAANCVALGAWGYWLNGVAVFITQWRWLDGVAAALLTCIVASMMYLHLRKSTHYGPKLALIISGAVTLALGGAAWLIDQRTHVRDVNRVVQGPAVYPSALRIAPSRDVADYLEDVITLKRAASRNRQASLLDAPLVDGDE